MPNAGGSAGRGELTFSEYPALLPAQSSTDVVHKTSSLLIGRQYPAEVTASFDPAARHLLKSVGHSARMWNPMLGRVIGLMAVAGPVPEDAASKPDARYTLPALEMRVMLESMRAHESNFTLTYTRLAGTPAGTAGRRDGW